MDANELATLVGLEDDHWWYQERRHLIARTVRRLRPGRAIDVGAAGGGNARTLRALGWSVVAIELSTVGCAAASTRGIPVCRADARALPVADGSFDLGLSFDMFEHVKDDHRAAEAFARALRPGGTAFVAVPADPRLWSAHDEAVGHVRRYDRQTLRDLLVGAGLEVEQLWSWNVLLRPVAAYRRRSSSGSDLCALPRPINLAFRMTVACERYVPLGRFSGVSLLALARRKG